MTLNDRFESTPEYRFWTACHDLATYSPEVEKELRATIEQVLSPLDRPYWQSVCDRYDKNELPAWFRRMTEESFV